MNERIRVLLKQAGDIQYDEDGDELTPILVGKDLERFAELIVQECASIVYKTDTDHADGLALLLLKHFGVKDE